MSLTVEQHFLIGDLTPADRRVRAWTNLGYPTIFTADEKARRAANKKAAAESPINGAYVPMLFDILGSSKHHGYDEIKDFREWYAL